MLHNFKQGFFLAVLAILTFATIALAAYVANILLINTSNTTYSLIGINVSTNIDYMAANSFFDNSEGLDTRILSGSTELNHMLASDRIMFTHEALTNTSETLSFTTSNSELDSFPIIVGNSGNITVDDAPNLELADNFSIRFSAYIDTDEGTNKNIIHKPDALALTTGAGTSGGVSFTFNADNYSSPTGGSGSVNWGNISRAYDNNITTYAYVTAAASTRIDELTLTNPSQTVYSIGYYRTGGNHDNGLRLELRSNSAWVTILSDADLTDGQWIDILLSDYIESSSLPLVDAMKWSFISDVTGVVKGLNEFRYNTVEGLTVDGITSGLYEGEVTSVPVTAFNGTTPTYFKNPVANYRITDQTGTIAGWVRTTDTAQGTIFASADEAAATNSFKFAHLGNGRIFFNIYSGTNYAFVGDDTFLNDGEWHLAVLTSDGEEWKMYLDNADLQVLTPLVGPGNDGVWFDELNNRDNVTIGATHSNHTIQAKMTGDISDVTVYDTALSAENISEIYFKNYPSSIVNHWPLNEGIGTIGYDSVGELDLINSGGTDWNNQFMFLTIGDSVDFYPDTVNVTSITDNSENWYLFQNNSIIYAEDLSITTNTSGKQLYYAPTTITNGLSLTTANLTDRADNTTSNWGLITWGENPNGIDVVMGSMIADYSIEEITAGTSPDILPEIGATMVTTSDAAKTAALTGDPMLETAQLVETLTNNRLPILLQYWWFYMGLAIIVFILVYSYFPNLLLSGIAFDAIIGIGIAIGIYDWWVIAVLVIWTIGMAMIENRRTI